MKIALADDFAVFDSGSGFKAEAAEGTRVRLGAVKNQPLGDGAFWQGALLYHLGPFYAESRSFDAGEFHGALFKSKDRQPFSYFVAVLDSGEGDELIVFEAFFPDDETFDKRMSSILKVLEKAEVKK
ncbi:MAG: hypothetical protein HN368_03185 [Spirochaetales bacterium]|nr:hypothetical protein [Spirochaetales bacterium]